MAGLTFHEHLNNLGDLTEEAGPAEPDLLTPATICFNGSTGKPAQRQVPETLPEGF